MPDADDRPADAQPLEADDDLALIHVARSLRAMADDERRSAAFTRSTPIIHDDDDADSGGRAEERGISAATLHERAAEHYDAAASRFDQSRGDHPGSRRR